MKKVILLCVFGFLLNGCGDDVTDLYTEEPNSTSGDKGPYVETSNIRLTSYSWYSSEDSSGNISIGLSQNEPLDGLRLGASDNLIVTINDSPQLVSERKSTSCRGVQCTYTYSYVVDFQDYPENQTMTISLEREAGNDAHTSLVFPPHPTLIEPTAGEAFSLSTDPLNFIWRPGNIGNSTVLVLSSDCGVDDELGFIDADNTHLYSPGTFQINTANDICRNATSIALELITYRYQYFLTDPALASDSFVRVGVEEEVITVQVEP